MHDPSVAYLVYCALDDSEGLAVSQATIHIKTLPELRARAEACAKLEGLSLPEYVRLAIREQCTQTEKLHGQRTRAMKAAALREGEA